MALGPAKVHWPTVLLVQLGGLVIGLVTVRLQISYRYALAGIVMWFLLVMSARILYASGPPALKLLTRTRSNRKEADVPDSARVTLERLRAELEEINEKEREPRLTRIAELEEEILAEQPGDLPHRKAARVPKKNS